MIIKIKRKEIEESLVKCTLQLSKFEKEIYEKNFEIKRLAMGACTLEKIGVIANQLNI